MASDSGGYVSTDAGSVQWLRRRSRYSDVQMVGCDGTDPYDGLMIVQRYDAGVAPEPGVVR